MCVGGAAAAVGTVGAIVSGVSSYQSAQAQASAADYQSQIYAQNAIAATTNAVNTRQAGYDEANKIKLETGSKVASQKAAMAANGIDVGEGTAVDLTDTTQYFGEMDALTTIKNANSRAAAYDLESENYNMQSGLSSRMASNYRSSAPMAALGTAMTGIGQVSSSWGSFTKTKTSLPAKGASTGGLQS